MSSLTSDILAKLPMPPGFEKLPEETQKKLRDIHTDTSLNWKERHHKIHKLIESLPLEQRRLLPPSPPPPFGSPPPFGPHGFPPMPPPGFEDVLPKDVYSALVAVHRNQSMTVKQKKQAIDEIMRKVPVEIREKLPLPPGFDRLPAEKLKSIRGILTNNALDFDSRHEKLEEFIKSLPKEERRLIRPPPPPGFENLPQEIKDQIDEIMETALGHHERFEQIRKVIDSLPQEIRSKLPPPPPMLPPPTFFKKP
ncbi:Protein Y75B7AR.1 [Aphelenchoides avenae]|nr:Protein Y75B7AR.1 [Aphelenchus avenae]